MRKSRKIALIFLAGLAIALAMIFPIAFRAGSLYWAKHSAHRIFDKFSPEETRNLNATPTRVVLPAFKQEEQIVEAIRFQGYLIRVPRPISREESARNTLLTYPGFQVRIMRPWSLAAIDAAARQRHFKDFFDEQDACYHTRLDELDAQRDLPSFKRYLELLIEKPAGALCLEEFQRPDIAGFILDDPPRKRKVIELYLPQFHVSCGVWFVATGGLTLNDIHEYLSVLKFDPIQ